MTKSNNSPLFSHLTLLILNALTGSSPFRFHNEIKDGPVAVFISWCAVRDLRCFAAYPLAGLFQAGFDHRLLERSPDVLAYADALPGSNPLLFFRMK